MAALDTIRCQMQKLFHTNPIVHVDVSMSNPKITIVNQEARIKGVYNNIFQLESKGKCYTLQYIDILTKHIRISELEHF